MNQVNLFGCGSWGSKIKATLELMKIKVNVIDPIYSTSIVDSNPAYPAIIATPTNTHFDLSVELIQRGYDILIEKPIATSASQIQALIDTNTNSIIMPGHLYMYHPLLNTFKNIITELGKPKLIHFVRTNFGKYQTDIDVLHNIAFHDFSILHHLYKDIDITHVSGFDLSNQIDRCLVVGTGNNIPFQLEASWLGARRERTITFYGDQGHAIWDSDANTIEVSNFSLIPFKKETRTIKGPNIDSLQVELIHFLDCVKHRLQPSTKLIDALEIETLINQAIEISHITNPNH